MIKYTTGNGLKCVSLLSTLSAIGMKGTKKHNEQKAKEKNVEVHDIRSIFYLLDWLFDLRFCCAF